MHKMGAVMLDFTEFCLRVDPDKAKEAFTR